MIAEIVFVNAFEVQKLEIPVALDVLAVAIVGLGPEVGMLARGADLALLGGDETILEKFLDLGLGFHEMLLMLHQVFILPQVPTDHHPTRWAD